MCCDQSELETVHYSLLKVIRKHGHSNNLTYMLISQSDGTTNKTWLQYVLNKQEGKNLTNNMLLLDVDTKGLTTVD